MGGLQKKIYDNSPYFIKSLIVNIKAYSNYKQRFNKEFYNYLSEHNILWNADIEKLKSYQKKRLKELLSEVFLYSEWYKNKMEALNINLNQIENDPIGILSKMPVLSKSERKSNTDLLINTNRKIDTIGYSSGTSGSPTKNYLDKDSINRSFALWKRFHKTIGLNVINKHVRFSGRIIVEPSKNKPPFWVYNYFEKQLLVSTYHMTDKNMASYVEKLNKFKPVLLDGYPSAIYVLSQFINRNNIKLKFTPTAIATTAETLYDYQRLEIEKAFNTKVYNQYASSEGSPFITECKNGNLHLNLDSGIFEFVNLDGKEASAGEIANLVVTSFRNEKTPLIRYNIEDSVLLPKKNTKCDCGCQMPVIEKIIGREDDILWTEEKGYVGRMGPAFKGLDGIVKSQIIQNSPKEVIVYLIVEKTFSKKDEEQFLNNLKDRLGNNVEYQINKVDTIPLSSNGKHVTVKRNFKIS